MSATEIWVFVSTALFLILVFKPAKAALLGGLDRKSAEIANELSEAHRLRVEAEALLVEARKRHQAAAGDAARILSFAHEEAQRLKADAEAALKESLERREKQATDRIAQAEAQAVIAVRNRAIDLALGATADMLKTRLSGEEGSQLIDRIVEQVPAKMA